MYFSTPLLTILTNFDIYTILAVMEEPMTEAALPVK